MGCEREAELCVTVVRVGGMVRGRIRGRTRGRVRGRCRVGLSCA